jgi:hypothetical protein
MNYSYLYRFDQFISENTYLTELNMNNCKLGDDGGNLLMIIFTSNSKIACEWIREK